MVILVFLITMMRKSFAYSRKKNFIVLASTLRFESLIMLQTKSELERDTIIFKTLQTKAKTCMQSLQIVIILPFTGR